MQLCQWQNKGLYGSGSRSNRHPGDDCILGATTKGYDSFTRENGGGENPLDGGPLIIINPTPLIGSNRAAINT